MRTESTQQTDDKRGGHSNAVVGSTVMFITILATSVGIYLLLTLANASVGGFEIGLCLGLLAIGFAVSIWRPKRNEPIRHVEGTNGVRTNTNTSKATAWLIAQSRRQEKGVKKNE